MNRLAVTAAVAALAAAVAGCGTATAPKPAHPAAAATPPPAPSPAPSSAPDSTAPAGGIGATFTATMTDGTQYDVTLTRVVQHAQPGPYDSPANYADHFAAAELTITGDTGQATDDANSQATAVGSDQVQYTYVSLSSYPNFSYGEFKVAPGQTVKGWVAFELPPGVTVAQILWGGGTWTVGG